MTASTQLSLLEQHPLSAAFPSMPENEIAALAIDIETHGQREPGVTLDGMILDGWHRYLACHRLGVQFKAKEFDGADPRSFVLSRNLHRRHLTASQRAAAVVKCSEWHPGGRGALVQPSSTNAEMAKEADVGVRTIVQAKRAEEVGLGDAVREGRVSARGAADVAKLPKKKREKAIRAIEDGKPPKAPKPPTEKGDVGKLKARIVELESTLAETKESLSEMKELAESAKAFEEKTEFKEMQILRVELRQAKRRRDELMAENGELKKEVQRWRKKADGK